MSVYSAVVNGQLVPVAPAQALNPGNALTPVSNTQGAGPNNLPGFGRMGGATNAPTGGGNIDVNASEAPTVSGAVGNVWNQPFWNNPLALTIIFFVLSYVILRWVHWGG